MKLDSKPDAQSWGEHFIPSATNLLRLIKVNTKFQSWFNHVQKEQKQNKKSALDHTTMTECAHACLSFGIKKIIYLTSYSTDKSYERCSKSNKLLFISNETSHRGMEMTSLFKANFQQQDTIFTHNHHRWIVHRQQK